MVERRRGNGYFLSGDVEEVMEDWRMITRAIYKKAVEMSGEELARVALKANLDVIFGEDLSNNRDVIWLRAVDENDGMLYTE